LVEAVVGFAIGLVTSSIGVAIASSATGYHRGRHQHIPVAVTAGDLVALWVALIGAILWASRRHGTGSLVRDFGLRIEGWWDVAGGALVGLGCQYILIPLVYLPFEQLDPSLRHKLSQPAQNDTGDAHTVGALIVLLLFIAVGAPIVEELFFRGLLLRALLGYLGPAGRAGPVIAVIVTGVLFGLAHFEALQLGGLALFGVVLGLLAWRTGRLGPGIAAHAAFNAAAVVSVTHLH
jgi:membrane protease YdiL (CAAX protease family)